MNPRDVKMYLAWTICRMYYDENTANKSVAEFNRMFGCKANISKFKQG